MTTGGRKGGSSGSAAAASGHSVQSSSSPSSSSSGRKGHSSSQRTSASRLLTGAPEMPLRILVSSDMVGAIIGKAGGTIRDITKDSKARVDVLRREGSTSSLDKVINVFGASECCSRACARILEVVAEEARATDKPLEEYPLRILAHNALIGRLIGKSGATIKRIMEVTGTRITISQSLYDPTAYNLPERVITIEGPSDNLSPVMEAESQIFSKLRACYESDMALAIAPSFLPPYLAPGHLPHHQQQQQQQSRSLGPLQHVLSPPGVSSVAPGVTGSPSRGSAAPPYSPTSTAMYAAAYQHMGSPAAAAGIPMMPQFPFQVPPMSPVTASTVPAMMPAPVMESVRETAVIYIPNSCVGAVIGVGGAAVRDMMHASGASIKVAPAPKDQERGSREAGAAGGGGGDPDPPVTAGPPVVGSASPQERKVTVTGSPEAQWKAQMMIFRKVLMDASVSPSSPAAGTGSEAACLRVEIQVPSSQVGRIIGKNGQTVRELQRLTRAQIKLPEPAEEGSAPPAPDAETPVAIVGDFYSSQVGL